MWVTGADGDTQVAPWADDEQTALGDTSYEHYDYERFVVPNQEEEAETEVYTKEALRKLVDLEFETDPTQDAPSSSPWKTIPDLRDDGPPTVKLPSLLEPALAPRRAPLPIGTSHTPAGIDPWSMAADQDQTWPAHRAALLDDRTAPSMFPTPEDTGKEQRPFPPAPTPPPPPSREAQVAITSSLLGMGVGLVIVLTLFAAVFLFIWVRELG